jgi:hypothetical protein
MLSVSQRCSCVDVVRRRHMRLSTAIRPWLREAFADADSGNDMLKPRTT